MDFEVSTQQELIAYESWKAKYMAQNPPPERRATEGLGWKFFLALVWAISAVIMVSVRTSHEFYQAEILSGVSETLARITAVNVLLAVEGGMVIAAAIKAAKEKHTDPRLLKAGIGLTVFISMVAGTNSSIGVIPSAEGTGALQFLRYILVAALGVGGSLVAWVAGEVMGEQIALALTDREKAGKELENEMEVYIDRMNASWTNSDEYKIVRASTRKAAIEARADVANTSRSVQSRSIEQIEQGDDQFVQLNKSNRKLNRQSPATKKVFDYLSKTFYETQEVPGPREIEKAVGVSVGTASTARTQWMAQIGLKDE